MAPDRRRILLTANTGWYFYNFRLGLLRRLRDRGHDVHLLCPPDAYAVKLSALGFPVIPFPLDRAGMNPARELATLWRLFCAVRACRPEVLHNHTVKLSLYGTLAGHLARVPTVVNSISGLGHLFLSQRSRARLARRLVLAVYRRAGRARFVFQNTTDLALFREAGVERCHLIEGSGVDTDRFRSLPEVKAPRVLFASRLLREKGIHELVEAVRSLREEGISFELRLAGGVDRGNPSSLREEEVRAWEREGLVRWIGHVERIDDELAACRVVVLPSWREGLSRILIEALAAGRAVLTTDVPGCADLVKHEVNGLLAPARSAEALAHGLRRLLLDHALCARLGSNARAGVLGRYDEETIFRKTVAAYEVGKAGEREPGI